MKAPAPLQNICPPGVAPAVFSVNGKPTGAIFTQDPNGNEYTIVGCRFGGAVGDVHLEGGFKAGTIPLLIDTWSDTFIKARVRSDLAGELDQNNVSLVVSAAGGGNQAKFPGFRFYAMREQVLLQSLPQGSVTLAQVQNSNGDSVKPTFASPYKNPVGFNTSYTGGVDRFSADRFGAGADVWDLSKLSPGFVPVDFQLGYWATETCSSSGLFTPGNGTIYNDGHWGAEWDPQNSNRIIVTFAEQHCHIAAGFMGIGDDESDSSYALNITVIGPKGVSPF